MYMEDSGFMEKVEGRKLHRAAGGLWEGYA